MKDTLTKEQSRHLIELGVPREKASKDRISTVEMNVYSIFTLTDLLEILPKEIGGHGFMIIYHNENDDIYPNNYVVTYDNLLGSDAGIAEELIDALYELAVFCLENGHLKFD